MKLFRTMLLIMSLILSIPLATNHETFTAVAGHNTTGGSYCDGSCLNGRCTGSCGETCVDGGSASPGEGETVDAGSDLLFVALLAALLFRIKIQ